MKLPIAEIGIACAESSPGQGLAAGLLPFLEAGLGARCRAVSLADSDLPDRLLLVGHAPSIALPPEPRIVLFAPAPAAAAQRALRTDWIEPGPVPVFGAVERFTGVGDLPWHYLGGGTPVSWTHRGGQTLLRLGFDVFGPLADALARAPETGPQGAAWGNARLEDLPAGARPLALTPWIDRLLLLLENLLDLRPGEGGEGPLPRWPGRARWAAALSHDVDMLFKWRLRSVLRLLLESPLHALDGRGRALALRWRELLARLRGGRDPWFLVDELMDLEESRGLHASLLFLAEPRDHRTLRYHLDRPLVRGLLRRVRERAFEVGLHGGWSTHLSGKRLQDQRHLLERLLGLPCPVTRQHWLRFDAARTWQAQESAGLELDSSLGFNDRPGFRAGTSLPFHPLDAAGRPRRLLELPLVLMDSQLFDELRLEPERATSLAMDALEQVRRVRGLLTLNWHPHTLCHADFPGRRELFLALLERVSQRDCFAGGLGEVGGHWRERSALLRESIPAPRPPRELQERPCAF